MRRATSVPHCGVPLFRANENMQAKGELGDGVRCGDVDEGSTRRRSLHLRPPRCRRRGGASGARPAALAGAMAARAARRGRRAPGHGSRRAQELSCSAFVALHRWPTSARGRAVDRGRLGAPGRPRNGGAPGGPPCLPTVSAPRVLLAVTAPCANCLGGRAGEGQPASAVPHGPMTYHCCAVPLAAAMGRDETCTSMNVASASLFMKVGVCVSARVELA